MSDGAGPEWEDIERVICAVLELPESEHEAYLAQRPPAIRAEVESLLAAYRESGDFLGDETGQSSAGIGVLSIVKATEARADSSVRPRRVTVGTQLGPYRIEAMVADGGMGVVYRAVDIRLNRPVAIKFLLDDLADPAARRRFQREAQTVSSLNHPHILTVHDAGEFQGQQYLVTEFVDAGTLKDWARAERRSWRQIVEMLLGVADGLAAAHAAGILHRDIKPVNVLVGINGYAKLADFGLATLDEHSAPGAVARSNQLRDSRAGIIVGSIAYMSPEQASGRPVDTRSDIFSFGVMLYELLAGRRPFEGATDLELLQTVIHRAHRPLGDEIPVALRAVVEKALQKDVAKRWQSMRELVIELRRLAGHGPETPAPQRLQRRIRWAVGAALVAMALMALSALIVVSPSQRLAVPARLEYTPLTNFADSATSPALSPDGRMLAFIRSEYTFGGPGQIYVKRLPDGAPVQLTHDDLYKRGSPKFSPDGMHIAYAALKRGSGWDTWVASVLGGPPRLFLANASGLTWIEAGPRQSRLLFSELTGRGDQMAIVSSTESRAQHRTVYMPAESGMAHRSYLSPDRKQVLLAEMDSSWLPCRLLPFDGRSPGKPVGPVPAHCTDAAWSPDGRWMYVSADTGNGYHIWRQPFPNGIPEQITFGITQEEGIDIALDGRSFVTSIGVSQSTVWFHDSQGDRQITSEGYGLRPSVSPDGRKLYYLLRAEEAQPSVGELWVADLESGQRQRLLPDVLIKHYAISADGERVVVVVSDDAGRSPVWLAALNSRSAPRQVTPDNAWKAYFGADGYLVFMGGEDKFVYRVKEDGSELQKVVRIDSSAALFSVSPDGKWIAIQDSTNLMARPAMLYPIDGGSPTRLCVPCTGGNDVERISSAAVSWSPDSKFLYLKLQESVYGIPLRPGQMLPPIPASGFRSKEEVAALPGTRLIPEQEAFPGPNPSIYAFTKVATHRNIYRVPVP